MNDEHVPYTPFIAHRSALIALLVFALPVLGAEHLRIGKITIQPLDVYSETEAKRGLFYRAAARLHVETHPAVIRKFLLFAEGDVYAPERLAETERNLRALPFIKFASVTASEPRDGVVDVVVTTQDSWSIAPETQAGSEGGEQHYGLSLTDTNLLGYGKEISLNWDKSEQRSRIGVDYQDPMLFRGYWNTHVAYGHTSDGYDHRLSVRRPFYSFATPWATELTFIGYERDDRLYQASRESNRFSHEQQRIVASFGRAIAPNDRVANRLTGGIRFTRDEFSRLLDRPSPDLPDDREFRYLFARFDHAENDFLKLNFVNKDLRYEDFNLGRLYSAELALSPRALGVDSNTTFMRVAAADGRGLGASSFVIPWVALESRFDGGARNTIAAAEITFVRRTGGPRPSATVGRLVVQNGWRLDRDIQFYADGKTGLRGYRAYAFSGRRALVLNLEQRFHLGRELLQLASPGLVTFIDVGNATNGSFRDLLRVKADVGVGIRVGLPRTPKNLIRIDLAYALQADPRGRRGLQVSVTSGQAF